MAGVLQPATTCSNSSRDRPNTPAASLLLLRIPLALLLSHVLVSTPTNVAGKALQTIKSGTKPHVTHLAGLTPEEPHPIEMPQLGRGGTFQTCRTGGARRTVFRGRCRRPDETRAAGCGGAGVEGRRGGEGGGQGRVELFVGGTSSRTSRAWPLDEHRPGAGGQRPTQQRPQPAAQRAPRRPHHQASRGRRRPAGARRGAMPARSASWSPPTNSSTRPWPPPSPPRRPSTPAPPQPAARVSSARLHRPRNTVRRAPPARQVWNVPPRPSRGISILDRCPRTARHGSDRPDKRRPAPLDRQAVLTGRWRHADAGRPGARAHPD